MVTTLDETHDPGLQSWVESAAGSPFPIQNLPFASFRRRGFRDPFRIGVAIGDSILDLAGCDGLVDCQAFAHPTLNTFMALGRARWKAARLALSRGLRPGAADASRWR